jgi:hypothetical protein
MSKPLDSVGLIATAIGGALIYGGIRGYSMLQVLQNLVTGKPITTGVNVTYPLTTPGAATSTADVTDDNGVGAVPPGGNQALALQLASSTYGWEGAEWVALQKLWNRESGFNNKAKNPSSGAYGIPQALPYSKMPKAAWPESAGGHSDAATQIKWGLQYIKGRYGTPSKAWAHETANSWY